MGADGDGMTTWDRNFVLIIIALLGFLWLTSCTTMLPQSKLNPIIEKNLGRELVIRVDGKVVNPVNERLTFGADAEVDVRITRYGYGMYGRGPLWAQIVAFPLPVLGVAYLRCAENREWETDTICTCRIELWQEIETVLNHEIRHCKGYGEF